MAAQEEATKVREAGKFEKMRPDLQDYKLRSFLCLLSTKQYGSTTADNNHLAKRHASAFKYSHYSRFPWSVTEEDQANFHQLGKALPNFESIPSRTMQ